MDVLKKLLNDNVGKLLVRLTVAGLMLFHGIGKWNTINDPQGAVTMIGKNLKDAGVPEFVKYGVIIGEVIAPLFIIVGLFTRPAALIMAINMVVAVCMAHRAQIFTLDEHGSYALELQSFYFFGALAIVFLARASSAWTVCCSATRLLQHLPLQRRRRRRRIGR